MVRKRRASLSKAAKPEVLRVSHISQVVEERIARAQELFGQLKPRPAVAKTLMEEFKVDHATAYRDIKDAEDRMQAYVQMTDPLKHTARCVAVMQEVQRRAFNRKGHTMAGLEFDAPDLHAVVAANKHEAQLLGLVKSAEIVVQNTQLVKVETPPLFSGEEAKNIQALLEGKDE